MTRKFKFKPSSIGDLIAVEAADDENWYFELYHGYCHRGTVPPVIVLNSNEWEEITEKPILVTEDGYEVYSYHNTLKEVTEDFEILPIDPDDASENPVFHEMANAKAYVEKHKLRYSEKDLLNIVSALTSYEVNTDSNSLATLDYRQGVSDAVSHAISLLQNVRNQKS